jgi:uncharacterized protein YhbP (UPF0306 family)
MIGLEPVLALLAEAQTMTLATLDPDGAPRATPVYFVTDKAARLLYLSDPAAQHSRNLQSRPPAAVAIYPYEADWRALRGLQMKGTVLQLDQASAGETLELYRRAFPFIDELASTMQQSAMFRFTPAWIRLIDNRREFGFQQEWLLA